MGMRGSGQSDKTKQTASTGNRNYARHRAQRQGKQRNHRQGTDSTHTYLFLGRGLLLGGSLKEKGLEGVVEQWGKSDGPFGRTFFAAVCTRRRGCQGNDTA